MALCDEALRFAAWQPSQVWFAALSEFQELDASDVVRAWARPESWSAKGLCWGLAFESGT